MTFTMWTFLLGRFMGYMRVMCLGIGSERNLWRKDPTQYIVWCSGDSWKVARIREAYLVTPATNGNEATTFSGDLRTDSFRRKSGMIQFENFPFFHLITKNLSTEIRETFITQSVPVIFHEC